MSLAVVLLFIGPAALLAGAWVSLNIRGAADALARRSAANTELALHTRGELGPAQRIASATYYRFLASVTALCGLVFTLGGLLEAL
ncbi:hypothetical protein AW27_028955 [Streptomyces sp. PCS3-D2]|uniref:hypothetical protein n=1 Tax=Streptomyces sp. PCS3-D2 TaxID=1460244 RepID=UPI000449AD11|nr:hypothetical protein [Streptomyces sp. PCS3-D2]WKV75198.1 hypothetical protein AW27_028955 [Streptomyces sp. PCS3-D2]